MSGSVREEWDLESVRRRCDEIGNCWIWKLSLKDNGTQPQACINGVRGAVVRRWMYDELLKKRRPEQSIVTMSCRDQRCCAPAHLVWSTRSAVMKQTYEAGRRDRVAMTEARRAQAIRRGWAKIDMEKANEIRLKAGSVSKHALAAEYGLRVDAIRAIVRNAVWRPSRVSSAFTWRP